MWQLAEAFSIDGKTVFWLVGGIVAVVAIISAAMTSIFTARAREQTRREIAAYLAEGSIDKDTAIAMLKSDGDDQDAES